MCVRVRAWAEKLSAVLGECRLQPTQKAVAHTPKRLNTHTHHTHTPTHTQHTPSTPPHTLNTPKSLPAPNRTGNLQMTEMGGV